MRTPTRAVFLFLRLTSPSTLVLCGVLAALAAGCGRTPSGPEASRDVTGTWDARFEGTVQGQRTPQADSFVMELRQSGSNVSGTLRFSGLDLPVALTGEVDGSSFTYAARAALGPGCESVVRAQTTVEAAGTRLGGPQTQSTCEGTAVGQVSATRRSAGASARASNSRRPGHATAEPTR